MYISGRLDSAPQAAQVRESSPQSFWPLGFAPHLHEQLRSIEAVVQLKWWACSLRTWNPSLYRLVKKRIEFWPDEFPICGTEFAQDSHHTHISKLRATQSEQCVITYLRWEYKKIRYTTHDGTYQT